VPQKQKLQLDSVRKLADHARNYHEYRSRLRETVPPAVPFLGASSRLVVVLTLVLNRPKSGLYLTDITFCREGNPSHRPSPLMAEKKLINFSKYHKMARIVQGNGIHRTLSGKSRSEGYFALDIQRFQVHYTLKEIEEMQDFLTDAFERSKHHGDLQDLYRRRYGRMSSCMSDVIADRTLFQFACRTQTGRGCPTFGGCTPTFPMDKPFSCQSSCSSLMISDVTSEPRVTHPSLPLDALHSSFAFFSLI